MDRLLVALLALALVPLVGAAPALDDRAALPRAAPDLAHGLLQTAGPVPASAAAAGSESFVSAATLGGDVDGDGRGDVLHLLRVDGRPVVEARGVADGAVAWSTPLDAPARGRWERWSDRVQALPDVTGDGVRDVSASVARYDEPGALGSYWVVWTWHVVLDGATGAPLWRHADAPGHETPLGYQVFAYADVEGDGRPELLALRWTTLLNEGDTFLRVAVVRGADGAVLRERLIVAPLGVGERAAAVGDATGDGQSDLVLLDARLATTDVVVEDGVTGRVAWRAPGLEGAYGVVLVPGLDAAPGAEVVVEATDGRRDFAVAYAGADGARLWSSPGTPYYQYVLPMGDATRDGRADLYAVAYDAFGDLRGLSLLDGATGQPAAALDGSATYPETLAELTGDGALDVVAWAGETRLLLDPAAGFAAVGGLPASGYVCPGTADANGDARPDALLFDVEGWWWEPQTARTSLLDGATLAVAWEDAVPDWEYLGCGLLVDAVGGPGADVLQLLATQPADGRVRTHQRVLSGADGALAYAVEVAAFTR
ncbi:MAG TPA: hypothetical protein VNX21_04490 [Candidatus Thermoplasmatota archaeon]|nr:hypothetical protein [Candidatus Thermoplasmatota archaeon]